MTALSYKKVLQEQNTNDPSSITSLVLTHKALTDVSCLGEFKNLERLDLGFNNLTSLEGLKSCTNLKWLSVVQNKLQSLKGIDGLNRLTVLNAGKNKLNSMDDVKSLSSLRALILNDNEISSVCMLDQMQELNTLVLSRNPISSLGDSLLKLKSITKLSLSNCQLKKVDSSMRSCRDLKELRLAHNEITTIPDEIGHLVKLQNLDLGNNDIARWSNLKVLSSLVNLRNLNLQGNPLAEKENLQKKVKKLLPNLLVFNARPIDKIAAKEVLGSTVDFSVEAGNELNRRSETKLDQPIRNKNSHPPREGMDDLVSRNERKELQDEKVIDNVENTNILDKRKKKRLKLQQDEGRSTNDVEALNGNPEETKDIKHKKKKPKQTSKVDTVNIIDTAENASMDYLSTADPIEGADNKVDRKVDQGIDAMNVMVTYPTKKKHKKQNSVDPAMLESQVEEIGLGGPSAWDV